MKKITNNKRNIFLKASEYSERITRRNVSYSFLRQLLEDWDSFTGTITYHRKTMKRDKNDAI